MTGATRRELAVACLRSFRAVHSTPFDVFTLAVIFLLGLA